MARRRRRRRRGGTLEGIFALFQIAFWLVVGAGVVLHWLSKQLIRLVQALTGAEPAPTIPEVPGAVMIRSPGGRYSLAIGQRQVLLFDGPRAMREHMYQRPAGGAVGDDGCYVVADGAQNPRVKRVVLWTNWATGNEHFSETVRGSFKALALSPDSRFVFLWVGPYQRRSSVIVVFDLVKRIRVAEHEAPDASDAQLTFENERLIATGEGIEPLDFSSIPLSA